MKFGKFSCVAASAALIVAMASSAGAHEELYSVVYSIPEPIANTKPGDAGKGKDVFVNRKKGNCLSCHALSQLHSQQFHGEVGPHLDDVGSRLPEGELRMRVVNSKLSNPDTIMPAFFRTNGLFRVQKKWKGKTIISAQDVEDLVAYLKTLKGK